MTDYLGAVLNPMILTRPSPCPLKPENNTPTLNTMDLSDWVLYVATALFIGEVLVCLLH